MYKQIYKIKILLKNIKFYLHVISKIDQQTRKSTKCVFDFNVSISNCQLPNKYTIIKSCIKKLSYIHFIIYPYNNPRLPLGVNNRYLE